VFSGHGERDQSGGYLELEDGALRRADLIATHVAEAEARPRSKAPLPAGVTIVPGPTLLLR
jgi:hypothetical protein